LEEI
jgi:hypothetical protein